MQNIVGKPVRRENFLRRQEEIDLLWEQLEDHNLLLLAPRRVGKTSLLLHLCDEPKKGWACIFVNVEAVGDEQQFFDLLAGEIREARGESRVGRILRETSKVFHQLKRVGPVERDLPESRQAWDRMGRELKGLLRRVPTRTVVLIDEFPIFLQNLMAKEGGAARARHFMSWFRDLRNDAELGNLLRFILCGSIGLDTVVMKAGMSSTINDFQSFKLGSLDDELADQLLERLALGKDLVLDRSLRAAMRTFITWPIPFHLQLLFAAVASRCRAVGVSPGPEIIREAYEGLFSFEARRHFSHWEERLRDSYATPAEQELARAILKAAALDPEGVSLDTIRHLRIKIAKRIDEVSLLLPLEHDGYLFRHAERYRFTSSLLRDWWRHWVVGQPLERSKDSAL